MKLGKPVWQATRSALQNLLSKENPVLRDNAEVRNRLLIPQAQVKMHVPAQIG